MFKRLGLFFALMLCLPTFALAAGTLSLSVSPTGAGTISIGGVNQTGTYTFQVATGLTEAVTVNAAAGNTIKMVTQNGVAITGAGAGQASYTYNIKNNGYAQSLVAYFNVPTSAYSVSVTASTGSGSVKVQQTAPTTGPLSGVSVSGTKTSSTVVTVSAIPAAGYKVTQITTANPAGTFSFSGGANVTATQALTSTQIGSATTVNATFVIVPTVTTSVQVGGSMAVGSAVGFTGSATSNDTFGATPYSFVVNKAGVQVVASGAQASNSYSFTPSASGDYTVDFTATTTNGGSATTTAGFHVYTAAEAALNLCSSCHNSRNPDVIAGFTGSTHWTNLRNNGDSAVAGDGLGSCATQKCHFKSTNEPACYTCHAGAINSDGTFAAASFTHPGAALASTNTCMLCHQGSHHGTPTIAYTKSSHYLNPYGEGIVQCYDCHNPHTTEASFPSYDAASYAKTVDGSCEKCHSRTAGKPYGIFSSNGQMVQPHTQYKISKNGAATNVGSSNAGWYSGTRNVFVNSSSSYVTPNNSCTDCHGHNNQVNAEYAETMHADPYGRWKSASYFKYRGYSSAASNPSNVGKQDGCIRCHTATGFVNFVQSNFQDLRAWGFANTSDPTGEVITCRACHVTGKGAITGEAEVGLPEGNVNGWNPASIRAYNKPFPAYYNYSIATTGKFITAVQYRDFKNSNVCIPCHSARNTATNGNLFKQLASFSSFTTLTVAGGSMPGTPHGVYQAAILDGKIGYQFSKYSTAVNGHATIGVGGVVNTGTTSGPCVTCHMDNKTATGLTGSATYRKHNFDIKGTGVYANVCSKCHGTSFGDSDLVAAESNFQAAVSALAQFMMSSNNKYNTPIIKFSYSNGSYSVSPMDSKRIIAGVSFTGNNAAFADLAGAYYNIKLLWAVAYGTSDEGAYAHNPQYMKQLVNDTMNALLPAGQTVAGAISALTPAAATTTGTINPGLTTDQQTAAGNYVNNVANHYATGTYKVQYVLKTDGSECANCHNPNETQLQADARVAWAESDHGTTAGAAWMPGSSHLWRNAGASTDFSQVIPANDCQRCHTTDGYAQFTGSNFTNITPVADATTAKTNSPLACNACHTDNTFARRAVPAVSTFYNISTVDKVTKQTVKVHLAANFPDVQESNICVSCHSARVSGNALVQAVNNGLSLSNAGFQNSHYMGAAGLMYMKAGFINFTSLSAAIGTSTYGKTLQPDSASTPGGISGGVTSTHRKLGTTLINGDSHNASFFVAGNLDSNGPCVTCHLKGYTVANSNRAGAGHSLQIDQDTITQVCNNCHSSEAGNAITTIASFKQYFLEPQSEVFQNALTLATTILRNNYGISYNPASYPYFYDMTKDPSGKTAVTDWTRGGALSSAAALKLHGACLNINLLSRDPAAYAHARTYARRLIYDSIDFLDDGVINLSVGSTAVATDPVTYQKGQTAYTDGTLTTLASGTTESMVYLIGWSRSTGAWSTPERP